MQGRMMTRAANIQKGEWRKEKTKIQRKKEKRKGLFVFGVQKLDV
jgi:hypothetical protein